MEYASRKKVSVSTLRRKIKHHQIPFKIESGKYLILDDSASPWNSDAVTPETLKKLVRELKEENAELKTLIATYEDLIK